MIIARLRDIMCDHPIKIASNVTVASATHLLLRYRINGILIFDVETPDKLIGVYTTTDALRFLNEAYVNGRQDLAALQKISDKEVGEVAAKPVVTVNVNDDVVKVIEIMCKENVHTIPIYDEGKLVGVLGRHDLLNASFYL